MKNLLLVILVLLLGTVQGQTSSVGKQSHAIKKTIQQYHYEAKPFDDTLSSYMFNAFIEAIDPSGFYLLKSDVEELKKFETDIDDQIDAKGATFFHETARIYKKRLSSADSLITEIIKKPFDFKIDESISYKDEDYIPYLDNYNQLKDRWRKWLKFSVLEEIFEGDYVHNPADTSIDVLLTFIEEAQKVVVKYERFEISSMLNHPQGYLSILGTYYLEALATYFDPHTSYFSDIEKENFEAELSKDNYAYGFSLKEDDKGKILIAGLTPGSAAWMSGAINKDDILLEVILGKKKVIDVTQLTLDELLLIFSTENEKSLILKLQKVNGRVEEVELIKSEVYLDDDVIKSVILSGDKKIGYIILPDFYSSWNDEGGLGCANDVAKNIVKLKKEGIDGLIIDLRNNGGGSVKEALDLGGIFIDYGPLGIVQNKYKEAESLKDMNKGAIYTGPLAIMVNGGSASASELFSGAMQDYNRAIIVGSQTYGKSTGQIILPLDPAANTPTKNYEVVDDSYGYLKITRNKYYGITNQTHQKIGITPDVVLRDYYELYEYGEKFEAFALSTDEVIKKVYYTAFPEFPKTLLQSNSTQRMGQNKMYNILCSVLDSINAYTDYYDVTPLNISSFQQAEQKMKRLYETLWDAEEYVSENFQVLNNAFDIEIMKMNTFRAEINADYLENVKKDMYIGETYQILVDYINSK